MAYKVTINDLEKVLNMINRQAGFDPDAGSLYDVKGAYCLDHTGSGVRMCKYTGGTCETDVLPRGTKKECFDMMHAFYAGMIAQEKGAR